MLNVVLLSVASFAECYYAEYLYTESHNAGYFYAEYHCAECLLES
jgi:hypothetical protein